MGAAGRATWGEAWVKPAGYEPSSEYRIFPRLMFSPCWWRNIEFNVRFFVVLNMARLGFSTISGRLLIRAS
jgi:hypothetical protein